jgi:hypothetical protein
MGTSRDRKRVIKAARKIPIERILDILRKDDDAVDDAFLICNRDDNRLVCWWSRTSGLMISLIEDDAVSLACEEYLMSHSCLVFESEVAVLAHAKAQGWERSSPTQADE